MIVEIFNKFSKLKWRDGTMSKLIAVQLSIFCNKRIEPTPNKITELMGKLNTAKDGMIFLPNILSGQVVDHVKGTVTNVNNLSFFTSNNEYRIMYMNDRIDLYLNLGMDDSPLSLDNSIDDGKKLMDVIMQNDSIQGSRLAINCWFEDALTEQLRFSTTNTGCAHTTIDYYNEKPVSECSKIMNSRTDISLGQESEALNVITRLELFDRIRRCQIDINTALECNRVRFSSNLHCDFLDNATSIIKQIRSGKDFLTCIH